MHAILIVVLLLFFLIIIFVCIFFYKILTIILLALSYQKTSRPRRAHHDIHALHGGGVEDPYLKKALAYPFQTISQACINGKNYADWI